MTMAPIYAAYAAFGVLGIALALGRRVAERPHADPAPFALAAELEFAVLALAYGEQTPRRVWRVVRAYAASARAALIAAHRHGGGARRAAMLAWRLCVLPCIAGVLLLGHRWDAVRALEVDMRALHAEVADEVARTL